MGRIIIWMGLRVWLKIKREKEVILDISFNNNKGRRMQSGWLIKIE